MTSKLRGGSVESFTNPFFGADDTEIEASPRSNHIDNKNDEQKPRPQNAEETPTGIELSALSTKNKRPVLTRNMSKKIKINLNSMRKRRSSTGTQNNTNKPLIILPKQQTEERDALPIADIVKALEKIPQFYDVLTSNQLQHLARRATLVGEFEGECLLQEGEMLQELYVPVNIKKGSDGYFKRSLYFDGVREEESTRNNSDELCCCCRTQERKDGAVGTINYVPNEKTRLVDLQVVQEKMTTELLKLLIVHNSTHRALYLSRETTSVKTVRIPRNIVLAALGSHVAEIKDDGSDRRNVDCCGKKLVTFDEVTGDNRYWWAENKSCRVVIILLFIGVYITATWLGVVFGLAKRYVKPVRTRFDAKSLEIIIEKIHCDVTLQARASESKHGPSTVDVRPQLGSQITMIDRQAEMSCSDLADAEKVDCGFFGMGTMSLVRGKQQCENRGCCWSPSAKVVDSKSLSCFHKKNETSLQGGNHNLLFTTKNRLEAVANNECRFTLRMSRFTNLNFTLLTRHGGTVSVIANGFIAPNFTLNVEEEIEPFHHIKSIPNTRSRDMGISLQSTQIGSLTAKAADITVNMQSTNIKNVAVDANAGWVNVDDCQARRIKVKKEMSVCLKSDNFITTNASASKNSRSFELTTSNQPGCWSYCAQEAPVTQLRQYLSPDHICQCKGKVAFGRGDEWIMESTEEHSKRLVKNEISVDCTLRSDDSVGAIGSFDAAGLLPHIRKECRCSADLKTTIMDINIPQGSLFTHMFNSSGDKPASLINSTSPVSEVISQQITGNLTNDKLQQHSKNYDYQVYIDGNFLYNISQTAKTELITALDVRNIISQFAIVTIEGPRTSNSTWFTSHSVNFRYRPEFVSALSWTLMAPKKRDLKIRLLQSMCLSDSEQDFCELHSNGMTYCSFPGSPATIAKSHVLELHSYLRKTLLDPIINERYAVDQGDPTVTEYIWGRQKNIGRRLDTTSEDGLKIFLYNPNTGLYQMEKSGFFASDVFLLGITMSMIVVLLCSCLGPCLKAFANSEKQYAGDVLFNDVEARMDVEKILRLGGKFKTLLRAADGTESKLNDLSMKSVPNNTRSESCVGYFRYMFCCIKRKKNTRREATTVNDVVEPMRPWFKVLRNLDTLEELASGGRDGQDKFVQSWKEDPKENESLQERETFKFPVSGIIKRGFINSSKNKKRDEKILTYSNAYTYGQWLEIKNSLAAPRFYPFNEIRNGLGRVAFIVSFNNKLADDCFTAALSDAGYDVLLLLQTPESEKIKKIPFPVDDIVDDRITPIVFSNSPKNKGEMYRGSDYEDARIQLNDQFKLKYQDKKAKKLLKFINNPKDEELGTEKSIDITLKNPILVANPVLWTLFKTVNADCTKIIPKENGCALVQQIYKNGYPHPLTGGIRNSEMSMIHLESTAIGMNTDKEKTVGMNKVDDCVTVICVPKFTQANLSKVFSPYFSFRNPNWPSMHIPVIYFGFKLETTNRMSANDKVELLKSIQSRLLSGAIGWLGSNTCSDRPFGNRRNNRSVEIVQFKKMSMSSLEKRIEKMGTGNAPVEKKRLVEQLVGMKKSQQFSSEERQHFDRQNERESFLGHMTQYKVFIAAKDRLLNRVAVLRSFTDIIYFVELLLPNKEPGENPSTYEIIYREMEHETICGEIGAIFATIAQAVFVIGPISIWFLMIIYYRTQFYFDLPNDTFSAEPSLGGILQFNGFDWELHTEILGRLLPREEVIIIVPPYIVGIGLVICVYVSMDAFIGISAAIFHETKFEVGQYWHRVLEWRKIRKEQTKRKEAFDDPNNWRLWRGFRGDQLYPPPPMNTGGVFWCCRQRRTTTGTCSKGGHCSLCSWVGTFCASYSYWSDPRGTLDKDKKYAFHAKQKAHPACCHRYRMRTCCGYHNCHITTWNRFQEPAEDQKKWKYRLNEGDLVRVRMDGWQNLFIGRIVQMYQKKDGSKEWMYDVSFTNEELELVPAIYDYRLPETLTEINVEEEKRSAYNRTCRVNVLDKLTSEFATSRFSLVGNKKNKVSKRNNGQTLDKAKLSVAVCDENEQRIIQDEDKKFSWCERYSCFRKLLACLNCLRCVSSQQKGWTKTASISSERISGLGPTYTVASIGDMVHVLPSDTRKSDNIAAAVPDLARGGIRCGWVIREDQGKVDEERNQMQGEQKQTNKIIKRSSSYGEDQPLLGKLSKAGKRERDSQKTFWLINSQINEEDNHELVLVAPSIQKLVGKKKKGKTTLANSKIEGKVGTTMWSFDTNMRDFQKRGMISLEKAGEKSAPKRKVRHMSLTFVGKSLLKNYFISFVDPMCVSVLVVSAHSHSEYDVILPQDALFSSVKTKCTRIVSQFVSTIEKTDQWEIVRFVDPKNRNKWKVGRVKERKQNEVEIIELTTLSVHRHTFAHCWEELPKNNHANKQNDWVPVKSSDDIEQLEFLCLKMYRNGTEIVTDNRRYGNNSSSSDSNSVLRKRSRSSNEIFEYTRAGDQPTVYVRKKWEQSQSVHVDDRIHVRIAPLLRRYAEFSSDQRKVLLFKQKAIYLVQNNINNAVEIKRNQLMPIHMLKAVPMVDLVAKPPEIINDENSLPIMSWNDKKEAEVEFVEFTFACRVCKNMHWVVLLSFSVTVVLVGVLSLTLGVLVLPERIVPYITSALTLITSITFLYSSLQRMLLLIENKFIEAVSEIKLKQETKQYDYLVNEDSDNEYVVSDEFQEDVISQMERRKVLDKFGFSQKNIIIFLLFFFIELVLVFVFILAGLTVFGGETATSATISSVLISTSAFGMTFRHSHLPFWEGTRDATSTIAGDIGGIVGALVREYNRLKSGKGVRLNDSLRSAMSNRKMYDKIQSSV